MQLSTTVPQMVRRLAEVEGLRHRRRTLMQAVNPDWDSEDEDVVRDPTTLPYNTLNQMCARSLLWTNKRTSRTCRTSWRSA